MSLLQRAGYRRGAPIDRKRITSFCNLRQQLSPVILLVLVSRRNAKNVSYATWKPPAPPSANSSMFPFDSRPTSVKPSPTSAEFPHEARQRAMSIRARPDNLEPPGIHIRQKLKPEETGIKPVKTTVMTRGTVAGRGKRVRALDQLEWLGGMSTVCTCTRSSKKVEPTSM